MFVDCQSLASNIEQTYVGQVSIGQASEASSPCPAFFLVHCTIQVLLFQFPIHLGFTASLKVLKPSSRGRWMTCKSSCGGLGGEVNGMSTDAEPPGG